jgi:plasmid stabilization system protein ParE
MAFRIVIMPQAERDIREAFEYINERAPEAAFRWYSGIRQAISKLDDLPVTYATAPEATKLGYPIHQTHFGKRSGVYRIVFRRLDDEKEIHVIAVRHGARDEIEPSDLD